MSAWLQSGLQIAPDKVWACSPVPLIPPEFRLALKWQPGTKEGSTGFSRPLRVLEPLPRQRTLTPTNAMNQIFDYAVYDRSGSKIGTVDNLWEDSSQQVTFLGISTGWLGLGRNHLVPAQDLEIDHSQQIVRVPWDEDRVKSSPSYDSSDPLNEAEETQIYQHYGLDRACATEGLPGAQESAVSSGATNYATRDRNAPATGTRGGRDLREGESVEIPLAEERLEVGKRENSWGRCVCEKSCEPKPSINR